LMQLNNTLQIGPGYIEQVEKTLRSCCAGGKILYVSDPIVDGVYGKLVQDQIAEVGRLKIELVDNSTIACAMGLAEGVIAMDINCIVGMGGGKVLDVCKYAAYISKVPVLAIPTTVANDGIASPIAVLKRKDNKPKSLGCRAPSMLILDTEIVQRCPHELIKAGIGDTISNYMALLDWEFAVERGKDTMNGYAHLMSKTSLNALMKTEFSCICPDFINVIAECVVLSGVAMDYAGSSRPVSGSEHLFSHALDYYAKTSNLHGIQTALGTVATLRIIEKDDTDVVNYLEKFEVEINPQKLNIDEETFVYCMQKATTMRKDRFTYLHEADLSDAHLKRVYKGLVRDL